MYYSHMVYVLQSYGICITGHMVYVYYIHMVYVLQSYSICITIIRYMHYSHMVMYYSHMEYLLQSYGICITVIRYMYYSHTVYVLQSYGVCILQSYGWKEELVIEQGIINTGLYKLDPSLVVCTKDCKHKTVGAVVLEMVHSPDSSNPG